MRQLTQVLEIMHVLQQLLQNWRKLGFVCFRGAALLVLDSCAGWLPQFFR